MVKIKFAVLFLVSVTVAGISAGQNPGLDQFLKNGKSNADAVKKNNPAPRQPQKKTLPAGEDNSWKVMVMLSRTVTESVNITSKTACKETQKGTHNYNLQANFSSDQVIGWLNGDDFQLITDVDQDLKQYVHPFKGSYKINSTANIATTNCDERGHLEYNGGGNINPTNMHTSFNFNKKNRQGDFQVALPESYTITASGKETGKSGSVDISDFAKAQINLMTAVCGLFQSWNYAVAKNAVTEQALISSPVNGGLASIGETKYGFEITYSESKTISKVPDGYSGTDEVTYATNVHILITNQSPPKLEAIIEPADVAVYKNFIPKGPNVDGSETEGNSLAFHIRIVDTTAGSKDVTSAHPFTVTYTLDKVSNYKGICMNYPRQNADDKPDLRWSKLSLSETHLKSSSETTLLSNQREGSDLYAFITCYDFAAYGLLKAHVHLDDDEIELEAHLKDNPDELYAAIPVDENHNKIADKWEKDIGIYNKISDPDFDEDAFPENQRRNGDGYTLFEEYRGFKVKDNLLPPATHELFENGHLRMDPNYKDIFIEDENGLFKTYYEPYNPSDLCWHYIDKDEMIFTASSKDPENRWMNFNKVQDHFYANQYALIFADLQARSASINCNTLTIGEQIDYDKVSDYESGSETGGPGEESAGGYFDQAVKHTSIIYIYSGNINYCLKNNFKPDEAQKIYQEALIGTTIHEIGHALGITHHHPSPTTGVLSCSMRYASDIETSHRGINSARHYYCHKDDTWKEVQDTLPDSDNAGKAIPLKTITHGSDNCYGKIDVKSDP